MVCARTRPMVQYDPPLILQNGRKIARKFNFEQVRARIPHRYYVCRLGRSALRDLPLLGSADGAAQARSVLVLHSVAFCRISSRTPFDIGILADLSFWHPQRSNLQMLTLLRTSARVVTCLQISTLRRLLSPLAHRLLPYRRQTQSAAKFGRGMPPSI